MGSKDLQKSKRCLKHRFHLIGLLLFMLMAFSIKGVYAQNEFHLSNEFSLTNNDVSGPGSNQSSLTEGIRYLNVLGISGNGKQVRFDYSFNLGAKVTDDIKNDLKTISLANLQGKITNKIHTINIGDTFESFTQYSLSTAIKGNSYRYFNEASKLPEVTLIYGLAYPRWDNVWRDKETKTIKRQVLGGRIRYVVSQELSVGFSTVRSGDDNRIRITDQLYDNNIYAMDTEYKPMPGLTIRAESAFNNTKVSPQEGAGYVKSNGYAHKIEAVGDANPSRVTLEYEKAAPDFTTLLGSATQDREKFKVKWRYKYSKTVNINTGFLWYRNNLNGQRNFTTHSYKPEVGITLKKLFNRQYSSADISHKLNRQYGGTTSTTDHVINLNYRDRFGLFDSDTNMGYTMYETKTKVRDSRENTYNTALSSRYTVGRFILKPSLYLGRWASDDELVNTTDVTYEYSLGLGIDVPDAKITSNVKLGQNKLEKDTGDDQRRTFANISIHYKPEFLSKLNDGMLFLRVHLNDFHYTTGSRNFSETSITTGLNMQL